MFSFDMPCQFDPEKSAKKGHGRLGRRYFYKKRKYQWGNDKPEILRINILLALAHYMH